MEHAITPGVISAKWRFAGMLPLFSHLPKTVVCQQAEAGLVGPVEWGGIPGRFPLCLTKLSRVGRLPRFCGVWVWCPGRG